MSRRGEFYSKPFWQRLRLRILERDGWRCVPAHEGCRFKAPGSLKTAGKYQAHVHHKIDREDGGQDVPGNLVATCAAYNIGEGKRRQAARARQMRALEQGQQGQPGQPGQPVPMSNGHKRPGWKGYRGTIASGASRDW